MSYWLLCLRRGCVKQAFSSRDICLLLEDSCYEKISGGCGGVGITVLIFGKLRSILGVRVGHLVCKGLFLTIYRFHCVEMILIV